MRFAHQCVSVCPICDFVGRTAEILVPRMVFTVLLRGSCHLRGVNGPVFVCVRECRLFSVIVFACGPEVA